MFRFQSVFMYGLMASAVAVGSAGIWLIRRFGARGLDGKAIVIEGKDPSWKRNVFGGAAFGLGGGLIGACPSAGARRGAVIGKSGRNGKKPA
jgi:uncharacterized membrane protein YedE/YeeE